MGTSLNTLLIHDSNLDAVARLVEEIGRAGPPEEIKLRQSGEWIALLPDLLTELHLSDVARRSSAPALRILVADSDEAQIELAVDGRRVAKLSSRHHPTSVSELEPWSPLLRGEGTLEDLLAIWCDDPLFSESLVARTAALFGIDSELVLATVYDPDPEGVEILALSIGTPEQPKPSPAGPPRLWIFGWSGQREGAVGQPFEQFYRAENKGGSGSGIVLAIGGTAIERGLVRIDSVEVAHGTERVALPLERDGGLLRAALPTLDLVAGPGGYGTRLNVWVNGVFTAPGEGKLRIELTAGSHCECSSPYEIDVASIARGRKPLHGKCDLGSMLQLWHQDYLASWILLEESPDVVLPRAVDMLVRYGAVLGERTYERIAMVPGQKPRQGLVKPEQLSASYLTKRLEGASSLALCAPIANARALEHVRVAPTDGMSVELLSIAGERMPHEAVPHVGFWASLENRSPSEREALEDTLARMIDELAQVAAIRQAFIVTWGASAGDFDTNPYEQACGIGGQCTSLRFWTDRWLRAVAPRMWIGRALRAHVDESRLAGTSDTTELAHGCLRVSTPSTRLDALERVLEPILPDEAAFRAGLDRLYAKG